MAAKTNSRPTKFTLAEIGPSLRELGAEVAWHGPSGWRETGQHAATTAPSYESLNRTCSDASRPEPLEQKENPAFTGPFWSGVGVVGAGFEPATFGL
jgi:hypothetical protein